GPFSAEYSGNAMGGVVNITTRNPTKQRIVFQGTLFSQEYNQLSTDERYNGSKFFASYENKIGDLGVFFSLNHLANNGHPQSQFASQKTTFNASSSVVTGAINGVNEYGQDTIYYGDSGSEQVVTDLYKLKLNYDFKNFQLRGILAYENRDKEQNDLNNYLRDASGNPIFEDKVTFNGETFKTSSFGASAFQERAEERRSLLLGLGISGNLGESDWLFDIYATDFNILQDEAIRTGRNPADPTFASANASFKGRFTEYDNTGWQTLDVQTGTESLGGNDSMRLSLGIHYSHYELMIKPFRYDSVSNIQGKTRGVSGGETSTIAFFAQWGWEFVSDWDLALGLRYEKWQGRNGFFDNDSDGVLTGSENHPDRDENGISPKFSLAHFLTDSITVRYSVAKALRFPLVEELYQNVDETSEKSVANAGLKPEDGLHHNLMLEKKVKKGFVRLNFFHEEIKDVIFSQNVTLSGNVNVRTFLPVDKVTTSGIEFIFNQSKVMNSKLNTRFNMSYIDSEITKNTLDTSIEGKDFPRMPHLRANLIVNYPLMDNLEIAGSFRYASNSYGDLDNSDNVDNVFGAQDDYLFVNARTNWEFSQSTSFSLGIDNIFNETAYVHHPWPSRTVFLEAKTVLE
ncbi:MAG: TonB-dependent receptor, partial [Methylococcales bacterium]|nr:TonB-dependent receptor [Methylococcales bacterium]